MSHNALRMAPRRQRVGLGELWEHEHVGSGNCESTPHKEKTMRFESTC